MPKLTSFLIVAFILWALTGWTIARSFASGEGGGAAPIKAGVANNRTSLRIEPSIASQLAFACGRV